jgi:hypothetical protein
MSARESDETILRKIETRLALIEQVMAAQSEATRALASQVGDFKTSMSVVQQVQEDWRTQKAARVAWVQIMDTIKWIVLFMGTVIGTIAAYLGMHKL